jgi:hypothetical protein
MQVPCGRFPRRVQLWTLEGKMLRELEALPLAENIPIVHNSCRAGRRNMGWCGLFPLMSLPLHSSLSLPSRETISLTHSTQSMLHTIPYFHHLLRLVTSSLERKPVEIMA